jgi:hypothetical protein
MAAASLTERNGGKYGKHLPFRRSGLEIATQQDEIRDEQATGQRAGHGREAPDHMTKKRN